MKKYLLPSFFILVPLFAVESDITAYHREMFGAVEFNRHGVAQIVTREGWVAINRRQQILYRPFLFDNGPDYVQEGLRRFVEGGKLGFVDEAGKKIIPAQFDFVYPFENEQAEFCIGCKMLRSGEHAAPDRASGKWGKVNKQGKVVYIERK